MRMNVAEIMQVNVNNLKRIQLDALKGHTKDILTKVLTYIEREEFGEVYKMLGYSHSGDSYGDDNSYINFAYTENGRMDIGEIVELMEGLK